MSAISSEVKLNCPLACMPTPRSEQSERQYALQGIDGAVEERSYVSENFRRPTEEERQTIASRFVDLVADFNRGKENPQKKNLMALAENLRWLDFEGKMGVLRLCNAFIASGSDSNVCYGISVEGALCVVKQALGGSWESWQREIRCLQTLNGSANVVRLIAANEDFIVEELCESFEEVYDDLYQKLKVWEEGGELDEATWDRYLNFRNRWTLGILQGLADIHEQGIVHSDVKFKNLLLGSDNQIKFADFGYAVRTNELVHGGTDVYYAPEQLQCLGKPESFQVEEQYRDRLDMWGAMVTLACLNRISLSQRGLSDFQERLISYEEKQIEIAEAAIEEAAKYGGDPKVKLRVYAELNEQYIASMIAEREANHLNPIGLFSDLTATNRFEELLIQMSAFNPAQRISAAEAVEFYGTGDGFEKGEQVE